MEKPNDTMNWESLIREAYPNALIERVHNYDDFYWGWNISPKFGHMLRFMVKLNDPLHIRFCCRRVCSDTSNEKVIFSGSTPANCMEPDFDFVKKILENYKCFMY